MSLPVEDDQSGATLRAGRHPLDPVSLVSGLLAVCAALAALLDISFEAEVVLPLLLVVGGVLGLVTAVRRGRD